METKKSNAEGAQFTINGVRGIVVGKDKNITETYYHTAVRDKIYLALSNGKEASIELRDWDIAFREGHDMLAVWIEGMGKSRYVAIKNFTTDKTWTSNKDIDLLANKPKSLFATIGCLNAIFLLSVVLSVVAGIAYWVGSFFVGYDMATIFLPIPFILYFVIHNSKKAAYEKRAAIIKQEIKNFINNSSEK